MSSGSIDTTFNSPNGYVIKTFFSGKESIANSVAIDSNNNVVVVGDTFDNNDIQNLFIARYQPDGTPDTSFAGIGYITKTFTTGKNTLGQSVVIDNNNNIVVTGYTVDNTGGNNMFIARYKPDGTPDTGFSGVGYLTKTFTAGNGTSGFSVAIDSNNNIVVTGVTDNGTQNMFIARYQPDGTPDTSFASVGYVTKTFTSGKTTIGFSVTIDSNNNIVVTGLTFDNSNVQNMFITRYRSNGNLDTSFAGVGHVTKTFTSGKTTIGFSVTIDSNDNIVVTGLTLDISNVQNMFITRYLQDGNLDTSFSGVGYLTKTFTIGKDTYTNCISIDGNNNIIVSGLTVDNTDTTNMLIARYLPDGNLDTSFNSPNGYFTKTFTAGKSIFGNYLSLYINGDIISVGSTFDSNDVSNIYVLKNIGYNVPTTTTTTTTEPICLPAGTPILTDQGLVAIEKIDITKHTINNKSILAITKTITPEKYLVCFEKYSLGMNIPSRRTMMTPGHEVLYKGKLVQAKHFLGRLDGVHKVPYNGKDILYNVLQEVHGYMRVNNMILETLNPENKVAKNILTSLHSM